MGDGEQVDSALSFSLLKVDEIKTKDRTIFALEKEMESTTGFIQKLQLQKDALDEQLFLVKEAECGLGSPKREIPGRAGDGAEHCGSPVRREKELERFFLPIAGLQ